MIGGAVVKRSGPQKSKIMRHSEYNVPDAQSILHDHIMGGFLFWTSNFEFAPAATDNGFTRVFYELYLWTHGAYI